MEASYFFGQKKQYHHRENPQNSDDLRKLAHELVDRLIDIKEGTNPDLGSTSEERKNDYALDALREASELTKLVAGWAIDHQIGLAMNNAPFGYSPAGDVVDKHLDHKEAQAFIDSHEHERDGSFDDRDDGTAITMLTSVVNLKSGKIQRAVLLNLMRPNIFALPDPLKQAIVVAFEAFDRGEKHPLFGGVLDSPAKKRHHSMGLRLHAIFCVEHRTGLGFQKRAAQRQLASLLGIKYETVRGWTRSTREYFGLIKVANVQEHGRRYGVHEKESWNGTTSPRCLLDASRYDDEFVKHQLAALSDLRHD